MCKPAVRCAEHMAGTVRTRMVNFHWNCCFVPSLTKVQYGSQRLIYVVTPRGKAGARPTARASTGTICCSNANHSTRTAVHNRTSCTTHTRVIPFCHCRSRTHAGVLCSPGGARYRISSVCSVLGRCTEQNALGRSALPAALALLLGSAR